MTRTSTLVLLALSLTPALVFAQSDREVAENMITRAANVCPGHSAERTSPTVKKVPVGALRVMLDRGLVMCPDRRLDAATPAVFYGRVGVFAWNPEAAAAPAVIVSKIDEMTRKDDYPVETLVWDAKGTALTQQTVPAFEARPGCGGALQAALRQGRLPCRAEWRMSMYWTLSTEEPCHSISSHAWALPTMQPAASSSRSHAPCP